MKRIILVILPIALFLIDRMIKGIASSINFGGGFVKLGFYKNYSGAFSLPIAGMIYNVIGLLLLLVFIFLFYKALKNIEANRVQLIAYGFIILGGASNIFDRLYFGYVIDYIQVLERSVFNIADVMLIIGVGILLLPQILKRKSKDKSL